MQHEIIAFLSSVPALAVVALLTVATAFYFWMRADHFRFTCFAYTRSWALGSDHRGEFQRLTRQSSDSTVTEEGLVDAESALCQTFKSAISGSAKAEVNRLQFDRAKTYLKITGQNDIRSPSMPARVGLFVLILAESVGTGYVLAPWLSTEITPSQANVAAVVLALAVAIVLALLTHTTGTEMAQFSRYRQHSGSEGLAMKIDLGDDQEQDGFYIDSNDHTVRVNPPPRRFANRVADPGAKGPLLLGVSGMIIVAIMAAIFMIRLGGIESQATRDTVSIEKNGLSEVGVGTNPFAQANAPALPPDVVAARQQTRRQVAESLGRDFKTQGMAAAIMLSLIYLVTQFTAFIIAFKSAFSGQGEAAYGFTLDEPSFETFEAKFLRPRIERSESFLKRLREARRRKNHRIGTGTFAQFIQHGTERNRADRAGIIDRIAGDVATGRTDEERALRWELALKNYSLSSEEQEILIHKVEESRDRLSRLLGPGNRAAAVRQLG